MAATIQQDASGIWVLRISGALRKEEMDAVQAIGIESVGPDATARVMVLVEEDFLGWLGSEEWGDMSFLETHGDQIEKIAIVCDPKWEDKMLMFTAAGLRRAPVRCFTRTHFSEACQWLGEGQK
jgi:hypothetical protein